MTPLAGHPPLTHEPAPDRFSQPFWDATAEHRLAVPRCERCEAFMMPPAPFCWNCQSRAIEWVDVAPEGTLYTFTVVRRALIPELEEVVPFVFAVVTLPGADDIRLATNLVNVDVDDVKIGMDVSVVWEELRPGFVYPRFEPAK